jgi:hypothetical protein
MGRQLVAVPNKARQRVSSFWKFITSFESTLLQMSLPVLHIWPGQWGLSSVDPLCLTAALYLQLVIPGKFSISYCTNPDLSPSGLL